MHRARVVTLTKLPWIVAISPSETAPFRGLTRSSSLVTPFFALPPTGARPMHVTRTISVLATDDAEPGFFRRIYRKIMPDVAKYKRLANGHLLYEDVTNNINYTDFFADFKMKDTFYSWFVIMELHVWMLMVRFMAEGKHGQEIRNAIVEAMWGDLNQRKGKLKNANVIALKNQVKELSEQFNAAIIGYDEGIMSDDKVLAAALWRRFFQCECNNPEHLEQLVIYVRKQMKELDRIPKDDLFARKTMEWIDYRKEKPGI